MLKGSNTNKSRTKRRRLVLVSLIATLCLLVILLVGYYRQNDNNDSSGSIDFKYGDNVDLESIYGDTDDDKILSDSEVTNSGLFKFQTDTTVHPSGYAGTAKFVGVTISTAQKPTANVKTTLQIPREYVVGGNKFLVTSVGVISEVEAYFNCMNASTGVVTADPTVENNYNMAMLYASVFTAIIVPDSVTYIEPAAFYGYGNLEYIQTPIVGQYIDRTTADDGEVTEKEDSSFASMFSGDQESFSKTNTYDKYAKSYYGSISDGTNYIQDINKSSNLVVWYDQYVAQQCSYFVPKNLSTVIVTQDTGLSNRAFFSIPSLKEVYLPDSCTDLGGEFIFSGSTNLVRVRLPKTVGTLGVGMFSQCTNLGNIDSANGGVPFAESKLAAFDSKMENGVEGSLTLPRQLTDIPEGFVYQCTNLKTVNIPSTVKTINGGAFYGASSLENINIFEATAASSSLNFIKTGGFNLPQGINSIGKSAFRDCKSFDSITVPYTSNTIDTLTIGAAAFNGCTGLTSITLPFIGGSKGNTGTVDSCFGYIFGTSGDSWWFTGDNQSSNGVDVTTSGSYQARQDFTTSKYKIFYIPSSLQTVMITAEQIIAPGAMQGLANVKTISINNGVTSIAAGSFMGTTSSSLNTKLETLSVPFVGSGTYGQNGYNSQLGSMFGTTTFRGSYQNGSGYYIPTSLKSVRITNSSVVYSNTFYDCRYIESVEITDRVIFMHEAIFYNCIKLKSLTIPFIGHNRGYFWQYKQDNYWYEGNNYATGEWGWGNSYKWYGHDYDNYIIDSLGYIFSRSLGNNAYEYRVGYSNWGGYYTHYIPKTLTNLTITSDYSMRYSALRGCDSLKNVSINATYIEEGALYGCSNIEELTLPFIGCNYNSQVAPGASHTLGWIFGSRSSLGTKYYNASQAGATFAIPKTLTTVKLASNTVSIFDYAFANCTSITNVGIVGGAGRLTYIGNYAFYNCPELVSVSAPNSDFSRVGNYAYYNCKNLYRFSDFSINTSTLSEIGNYAFAYTSLGMASDIDFTNISRFGDYCFSNCVNIKNVDLSLNTVCTYFGEGIFADCSYLTNVKLNKGLVSKWLFKNCTSLASVNLTDITTEVPDGMFFGCSNLQGYSITIDESEKNKVLVLDSLTTKIGANAFTGCSSLVTFEIPTTVTSIGTGAFSKCTGLASMIMPSSVKTINPNGWIDCDGDFCFYVYDTEENWPKGWVGNWNCDYPVYIIGDSTEDIFTYEYSSEDKGYYITGLVDGKSLSNYVSFPARHNGLNVYGIKDGGSDNSITNKISKQSQVSTVVLPSTYKKLENSPFVIRNIDPNLLLESEYRAIDIYLDMDLATAENCFGEKASWTDFLGYGIVYTNEYWTFISAGTTTKSTVPALDMSTFTMEFDNRGMQAIYDGSEIEQVINKIVSPGITVGLNNARKNNLNIIFDINANINYDIDISTNPVEYTSDKSLFLFEYSNNINAGNANVYGKLSSYYLNKYNSKRVDKGQCKSYFINDAIGTFVIEKKPISVYPYASGSTQLSKDYDGEYFYLSSWGNDNVEGLQDTPFKLKGLLRTASSNAGLYEEDSDYKWEWWTVTDPNGKDVSKNFEITVEALEVTINPQKVIIEWTGGKWNADNSVYQYGYTGQIIEPTAVARKVTVYENGTVEKNGLVDFELMIDWATVDRPEIVSSTGMARATIPSSKIPNYHLVDSNGHDILDINGTTVLEYQVQKVEVVVQDVVIYIHGDYVIGIDDDYWYIKYDNSYIANSGLGPNSRISGIIRSAGKGENLAYSSSSADPAHSVFWEPDQFTINTNLYDFIITQELSDGTIRNENDSYNVILDIDIVIKYTQLEIDYCIDEIVQNYTIIKDTDLGQQDIHKIDYVTKGDPHTFTAMASNANVGDYTVTYAYNNDYVGTLPLTFQEIGTYRVNVKVTSSKNYSPYNANIRIYNNRSDVVVKPFTKEWDDQAVNAVDHVLDKAFDQEITAVYYLASDTTYSNPLSTPPIEIGEYVVHLTVLYPGTDINTVLTTTQYYNNYDKYIRFSITKRKLHIDFTDPDLIDTLGYSGSKEYDGYKVEYSNSILANYFANKGYILSGHQFTGHLMSADCIPNVYANSTNYWVWFQQWSIYVPGQVGNLNDNYEIVLENQYTINNKKFIEGENYTITTFNVTFDGNGHMVYASAANTVTPSTVSYDYGQGYVPMCCPFINASTSSYVVYVKFSAQYYDTLEIRTDNYIHPAQIQYDLPSETIAKGTIYNGNPLQYDTIVWQYNSFEHFFEIPSSTLDPFDSVVKYKVWDSRNNQTLQEYSTTKYPFVGTGDGTNDIYLVEYSITRENYETVTGTVQIIITIDGLAEITDATMSDSDQNKGSVWIVNYNGTYDEDYHTITYGSSHSNAKFLFCDTQTGKYVDNLDDLQYCDAGEYDIWVRVVVPGYIPYSYPQPAKVRINGAEFNPAISVNDYDEFYDGEEHTVELVGVPTALTTGLTASLAQYALNNYTVSYTMNNVLFDNQLETGWSTDKSTISFKNVGTYTVYIKISCENFKSMFLSGTVTIKQATLYGKVEPTETKIVNGQTVTYNLNMFEYTGYSLDSSKIFVSTTNSSFVCQKNDNGEDIRSVHDGSPNYYFYNATKLGGTYSKVSDVKISAPTMLGVYYVSIEYPETKNCKAMTANGYFEIVERVIHVIPQSQYDLDQENGVVYDFPYAIYQDKYEYDGLAHSTVAKIYNVYDSFGNPIPKDSLFIEEVMKDGSTNFPSAIGDYEFTFALQGLYASGVDLANYVLDTTSVTMSITKRNVEITIYKEAMYVNDSTKYAYQSSNFMIDGLKTDGTGLMEYKNGQTNDSVTTSGSLLSGHYLTLDFETYYGTLQTYYYPAINPYYLGNTIIINEVKVYDSLDVSTRNDVTNYYNINLSQIRVVIGYGDFEFDVEDTVVTYDGKPHYVYEQYGNIVEAMRQTPAGQGCTFSNTVLYSFDKDSNAWVLSLTQTEVGTYEIYVSVTVANHNRFIKKCRLIIQKADLDISIETDGVEIYDANEHFITYEVTNIDSFADEAIVKYYNSKDASLEQLQDLFNNLNPSNPYYHLYDKGQSSYTDAGTYYVVVYYPATTNYNKAVKIETVEYKQRDVYVKLALDSYHDILDYSGALYKIGLAGATIDIPQAIPNTGLLTGHTYKATDLKNSYIVTKLPNAGTYGPNDFQFGNFVIIDESGNLVRDNYHPVLLNDVNIVINKIPLTPADFYISEEYQTKEYDGKVNAPKYYCESDGKPTYTFYIWDPVTGQHNTLIPNNEVTDVGTYYVTIDIAEGTNYFAYDTNKYGIVGVYLTVTQKTVTIDWKDLELEFTNTDLAPKASFTDVNGQQIDLRVRFYTYSQSGTTIEDAKRNAGQYIATAEFYSAQLANNYILDNDEEVFIIKKKVFTYYISEDDSLQFDATEQWHIEVNPEDIEGMYEGITFSSPNDGLDGNGAVLYTVSNLAGVYDSNDSFVWDIRIMSGDYDITNSIEIEVVGMVIIYSREITYTKKDVYTYYTGLSHTIWEGLQIVSPDKKLITALYSIDGVSFTTEAPNCTEVGQTTVYFKLTANGYESVTDSLKITVAQAESFITITKPIDKAYDGVGVDSSTISYTGRYNGQRSDLVFEFYSQGVLMTEKPIDVGEYTLHVYSKADYDSNGDPIIDNNYSLLDFYYTFNITPATIDVDIEVDKEVYQDSELNVAYSTSSVVNSNANLSIYEKLYYQFDAASIKRGTYIYTFTSEYDASLATVDGYTNVTLSATENGGSTLKWKILSDTRFETTVSGATTNPLNTSDNYIVNFKVTVVIHYQYMDDIVSVGDVTVGYDGQAHSCLTEDTIKYEGTAVYTANNTSNSSQIGQKINLQGNVNVYFSLNNDPDSYSLTHPVFTDPIVDQVIFVKFSMVDGLTYKFEDYYTSYKLNINFLQRTVTASYNDYVYDSSRTSIGVDNGNGSFLPDNYTVTLQTVNISGTEQPLSDFNSEEIKAKSTVVFYKNGYTIPLDVAKDAGTYKFIFTIPKSSYYAETVYEGTVTIKRATIYILGTITSPYDGNSVRYGTWDNTSQFTLSMSPDILNTIALPAGLEISGVVATSAASVGVYSINSAKQIYWENADYNVTENGEAAARNYNCSLEYAKIEISKGIIQVNIPTHVYEYQTGVYRFPEVTVINPHYSFVQSITYKADGQNEFLPKGDGVGYFYGYNEKGTYNTVVKINCGQNYEELEVTVPLTITATHTTISLPGLGKVYNGEEITFPSTYTTNNTEMTLADVSYWYYQYDELTSTWVPMTNTNGLGERPVNVGKYQIYVHVNKTKNFTDFEGCVQEFEITPAELTVSWVGLDYVYNGQVQKPKAVVSAFEEITLIVDSAPYLNGDSQSIAAGLYTATVHIDDKNYVLKNVGLQTSYQIRKRPIEVSLTGKGYYNGSVKYFTIATIASALPGYNYNVSNLVPGHTSNSVLATFEGEVGHYTSPYHFNWLDSAYNPIPNIKIIDTNMANADVTDNYEITYAYSYEIDYSSINFTVNPIVVEYDGLPHAIDAVLSNVGDYKIYASTIPSSSLSDYKLYSDYKDSLFSYTDVGIYPVHFAVVYNGNIIHQDSAAVTITVIKSNLTPKDPYLKLEKEYDGLSVVNPEIEYADMTINPRTVYYKYYKVDASGNIDPSSPISVTTSTLQSPNIYLAGDYRLVISLSPSQNYDDTPLEIDFTIKKRIATIYYPQQITRVYDILKQQVVIDSSKVLNLVPGDTFVGTIQTVSADVGLYSNYTQGEFDWLNGYKIVQTDNSVVTSCYDLVVSMSIQIIEDEIEYEIASYNGVYDGLYHTVDVQVTKPSSPIIGYSTNPDAFKNNSLTDQQIFSTYFSTDPSTVAKMYKSETTVYVMIMAPNYNTVKTSAKIIISGLPVIPTNDHVALQGQEPSGPIFTFDSCGTSGLDFSNQNDLIKYGTTSIFLTFTFTKSTSYVEYNGVTVVGTQSFTLPGTATSTSPSELSFVLYTDENPQGLPFKVYVYAFDKPNSDLNVFGEVTGNTKFEFDSLNSNFTNKNNTQYVPYGTTKISLYFEPTAATTMVEYNGMIVTYPQEFTLDAPTDTKDYTEIVFKLITDAVPTGTSFSVFVYMHGNLDETGSEKNKEINYDGNIYYNGLPYMNGNSPTVKAYDTSDWKQTVTYYVAGSDGNPTGSPLSGAPINAGKYVMVIHIEDADSATSTHNPFDVSQTFSILPKEVEIIWEDTTAVYDGNLHAPSAYYVDVNGDKQYLVMPASVAQINAGTNYPAQVTITDPNYKVKNNTDYTTWKIEKAQVAEPSIATDLVFEYGDEIVIKDIYGNKYIINNDGTFSLIDSTGNPIDVTTEVALYKLALDADINADRVYGAEHKLTVSLLDPNNYQWATSLDSLDLEFMYVINPKKLTKDDLTVTYTENQIYDQGNPIEPSVTVEYNGNTLVLFVATGLAYDYNLAYSNNINITTGLLEKAHIIISGDQNYDFYDNIKDDYYLTYDFNILAEKPKLLVLKSNAKVEFIEATFDKDTQAMSINETNSSNLVSTVVRDDPDQPNFKDIYLGHLYQGNTIESVLKQFDNDYDCFKVIDYQGQEINPTDWATLPMGTGWTIELYLDNTLTTKVDSIETVMYGDIDGNGLITVLDAQVIKNIVKGVSLKALEDYGVFIFAMHTINNPQVTILNSQKIVNLVKLGSNDSNQDFNSNYKPN